MLTGFGRCGIAPGFARHSERTGLAGSLFALFSSGGFAERHGRFAEAYDLLAHISSAMQVRGDLAALGKVEWETSWILEHRDQPVQIPGRMAAALSDPTQLSLF